MKKTFKYTLIFFSLCDLFSFMKSMRYFLVDFTIFTPNYGLNILSLILFLSLLLTAYFNIKKPEIGIIIYYFQFPIRLMVFVMTFGFIMAFNIMSDSKYIQTLSIIIGILELFRLGFSIYLHIKLRKEIPVANNGQ